MGRPFFLEDPNLRIYNSGSYGRGIVFVTPGRDHPETSDWMKTNTDSEGKSFNEPIMFTVKFENGVAEVPDNLGRYMIDKGLARKSRLILPPDAPIENARRAPMVVGRPLADVGVA